MGEVILQFNDLQIYIDNIKATNSTIINPISENRDIVIEFILKDSYQKDFQGRPIVIKETVELCLRKKIKRFKGGLSTNNPFIEPIGYDGYEIKLPRVSSLINQINLLAEDYKNFDMCIASSIRILFDLTTYLYQTQTRNKRLTKSALEEQVKEVIEAIRSDTRHFTNVNGKLSPRYKICKNIFDPGLFEQKVQLSNLGSHTGTAHISYETLKDIAQYAGYYVQLVDAHFKVKGYL